MADFTVVALENDKSANRFKRLAVLQGVFCVGGCFMEYMSIAEAAAKWSITNRRIQVLCSQGRIPGACRIGNIWAIPRDAEKPTDARIRSGRYCKTQKEDGIDS